jgi:cleavage and polyadenylation specificity factor subunit 1
VFFSKKLNPAQQKYSAYDRELLAIYEAVKHFRHMLEARHFNIFTDHKPITYSFQQKRDKCSPRQLTHLDFIAQFTTDNRDISGQNVVADTLSRVESVSAPPSYDAVAASQDSDDKLQTLRQSNIALRLEKLPIPGTTVSIYCDTFAGRPQPYIPASLRLQVLQSVHDLSQRSNSETGRTAFCVAGRAEGLPQLGKGLPVLPALQSHAIQSLHWATLHRRQPDFCTST